MANAIKLGTKVTYRETYNGNTLLRTGTVINTNYGGRIILRVKGFSCAMDCRPEDVVWVGSENYTPGPTPL